MIRTKVMSAIIMGMKVSVLGRGLKGTQADCVESHTKRIYRWDKSSRFKMIQFVHSPLRHLIPNQVQM
jgi:hypothetical protein